MCNLSVLDFFIDNTKVREFDGKRVLEIGSRYVNGSVRPLIERCSSPKEYLGVDIESGKFVDVVLPADKIAGHFGSESFDVVVTTELLEHVIDWRVVIDNMKKVIKRGGHIYVTTCSRGFVYHGYPYDFWRYELEDLAMMFADFEAITLKKNPEAHGVFLKAKKPENYVPADLSGITLYSMVLGRRTRGIPNIEDMPFRRRLRVELSKVDAGRLIPPILLDLLPPH